jgi:hypothetical protein
MALHISRAKFAITGGVAAAEEVAPHANHPLARLRSDERHVALGELIIRLASDKEMISDGTQKNQGDLSCPSSPYGSAPTSE